MNKWDIVLLTYPFTDLSATKVRPALAISRDLYNQNSQDAVFIVITTNTARRSQYDIIISRTHPEFSLTGLRYHSAIRADKIFALSKRLVTISRSVPPNEWEKVPKDGS